LQRNTFCSKFPHQYLQRFKLKLSPYC
jgi:hypothetical protein